ncbi:hypothetical protein [Microbacterium sp.]|uniref:hypothetical protein n=1 Tax=Microbacterium sp. TaxID=51671 RepID=UPI003F9610ED
MTDGNTDDLKAFARQIFAATETARVELTPEPDADDTLREFTRGIFANNDND